MDREVVYQYIQHPMIAKDFAAYLALYNKYKTDYAVEDLLRGKWTPIILGKIRNASLDEHLSIVGLLNGKLSQLFADCYFMDAYVTKLYGYMTEYRDNLPEMTLESIYKKAENDFQIAKKSELLTKNEEKVFIRTVNFFENEISEKQKKYKKGEEEFSLREFATGLGKFNSFELKNAAVASQLVDGNIFLGLSCGNELGEDLQDEVRKSMIGAYLSLSKHNKMFFNGGIDDNLEELEDKLYAKFLEYIRKFS